MSSDFLEEKIFEILAQEVIERGHKTLWPRKLGHLILDILCND